MGLDFTALSFETANKNLGSACAVGMVRIRDGVMVDRFSSFINYPRSLGGFDAYATELHGITPKDLIGAPLWSDVLPRIVEFIGNDYVVAHNSEFDFSVLAKASEEAGVTLPDMSHFCTLKLAKRALPRLKRHKLSDISEALDLGDFTTHDTEANALVAGMICIRLADREELSSLSHIMSKYGVREGQIGLGQGYYVPAEPAVEAVEAPVAPAPVAKVSKPVEAPVAAVEPEPTKAPEVKPVVKTEEPAATPTLSSVKGQRISFVGGFELAERASAKEAIAAQGGKYLKNVRPDTTLLVIGTHHNPNLEGIVVAKAFNDSGSKIAFMSKDEFLPMLLASN